MEMIGSTDALFDKIIFGIETKIAGGVDENTLKNAVIEAFSKFCRESDAWLNSTQYNDITNGTDTFNAIDSTISDYAGVSVVQSVKIKSASDERGFHEISELPKKLYSVSGSAVTFAKGFIDGGYAGGSVLIGSSLVPLATSSEIDKDIASRFMNALIFGAITEISAQIRRPWYDPEMFALYDRKFSGEITHALNKVYCGQSMGN